MRAALVAMLALAACSIPEKHFDNGAIDAPQQTIDSPFGLPDAANAIDANPNNPDAGAPFACMGQPFPTTAPQTITISGVVANLEGGATISGATVGGYPAGSTTALITVTSDGSGNFSASVPTGGQAVNGYIKATATGFTDAYFYPEGPIYRNSNYGLEMFPTPLSTAGLDATKAQMLLLVVDCNGLPLADATITVLPAGGQVQYVRNGSPDPTQTATDSSGAAFVFDSPPGTITLNAVVAGTNLRTQTFPGAAGAMTESFIQP